MDGYLVFSVEKKNIKRGLSPIYYLLRKRTKTYELFIHFILRISQSKCHFFINFIF